MQAKHYSYLQIAARPGDDWVSSEPTEPTGDEGESNQEPMQRQRFPSSYFKPKPVKVGEELDVTVSEVSRKGDGVARIQGYVIFIPSAKQGEQVKIRITTIRPNYAIGELISGQAQQT